MKNEDENKNENENEFHVLLCPYDRSWPCIHQWIERQAVPLCPVCKAGIGADKVIPVYSRGSDRADPRAAQPGIPNRPAGQRPQPERQANFANFGNQFGGGFNAGFGHPHQQFHFSAGFGLFPSMFGLQFVSVSFFLSFLFLLILLF